MSKIGTAVSVIVIVLVLLFGGIGIKALFFTPTVIDKSMDMAYEVMDDTLDGDKAIREYEWFKRQAESMIALEKKEKRAIVEVSSFVDMMGDAPRSEWDRGDKGEYDRLNSNKVAVQNMLDEAIAEYNARSEMANRAIFKDNLPTNISRAVITGLKLTK